MKTDVSLVLNNGAGTWLNNFLHCFIYESAYVAIIRVFKTHYAMLSKGRDFFWSLLIWKSLFGTFVMNIPAQRLCVQEQAALPARPEGEE